MGVQINYQTAKRFIEGAKLAPADRDKFLAAIQAAKENPTTLTQITHEAQRVAQAGGGSRYQTKVQENVRTK